MFKTNIAKYTFGISEIKFKFKIKFKSFDSNFKQK